MMKTLIFCEGITDQFLIADILEIEFRYTFKKTPAKNNKKMDVKSQNGIEIIDVGGCTNLKNAIVLDIMKDNTELGGKNVVVFDADYEGKSNGNKGFNSCKKKLEDIIKSEDVIFDFFIWPNNESDGEVEDIVVNLIAERGKPIFDCLCKHSECIEESELDEVKIPGDKEKINFYLYTLGGKSELSKRDYKNSKVWNLDKNLHSGLSKFIEFISEVLKK